jgi:hypothetical protein
VIRVYPGFSFTPGLSASLQEDAPAGESLGQGSAFYHRTAQATSEGGSVSLLWIILIVILVLALLGFFTRGRW